MAKESASEKIKSWWHEFRKDLGRTLSALLFFALAGVAFWVLLQLLILFFDFNLVEFLKTLPFFYPAAVHIGQEITGVTALGMLYFFSFASLFFLPIPLELAYINYLTGGVDPSLLLYTATLGLLLGQLINYLLGRVFGGLFKAYIKRKTKQKIAEKLKKYGIIAIFLMNLLPMPFPLFNFVVGLFRYPFRRWFPAMLVALLCKNLLLNLFF